ncbi:uncharacterized protein LOC144124117 [Amblyomma americanum]
MLENAAHAEDKPLTEKALKPLEVMDETFALPVVTGGLLEFETGFTDTVSALKDTVSGQEIIKEQQIVSVQEVKPEELGGASEILHLCPRVTGGLLEAGAEWPGMEGVAETQKPQAETEVEAFQEIQIQPAGAVPEGEAPAHREAKAPEATASSEPPQPEAEVRPSEEIPSQAAVTAPEGEVTSLPEAQPPEQASSVPAGTAEVEVPQALTEGKSAEEIQAEPSCAAREGEAAMVAERKAPVENVAEIKPLRAPLEQKPSEETTRQAAGTAPESEVTALPEAKASEEGASLPESAAGADGLRAQAEAKHGDKVQTETTGTVLEGEAAVAAEFKAPDEGTASAEGTRSLEGTARGEERARSDEAHRPLEVTDEFFFPPMATGGLLEFATEAADTVSALKDTFSSQEMITKEQIGSVLEVKPEEELSGMPEVYSLCPRVAGGLLEAEAERSGKEGVETQKPQTEPEAKASEEIQAQPAGALPEGEAVAQSQAEAHEGAAPSEGVSEAQAPQAKAETKPFEEIPAQAAGTTSEGECTLLPEAKVLEKRASVLESTAVAEAPQALTETRPPEEIQAERTEAVLEGEVEEVAVLKVPEEGTASVQGTGVLDSTAFGEVRPRTEEAVIPVIVSDEIFLRPVVTGGLLESETGIADTASALTDALSGQKVNIEEEIVIAQEVQTEELLGCAHEIFSLNPRVTGGLLEDEAQFAGGVENIAEKQEPQAQAEVKASQEETQPSGAAPQGETAALPEVKAPEERGATAEITEEAGLPREQAKEKPYEEISAQPLATAPEGEVSPLPDAKALEEGPKAAEGVAGAEALQALTEAKPTAEIPVQTAGTAPEGAVVSLSEANAVEEGAIVAGGVVEAEKLQALPQVQSSEVPAEAACAAPKGEATVAYEANAPEEAASVPVVALEGAAHGESREQAEIITPLTVMNKMFLCPSATGGLLETESGITDTVFVLQGTYPAQEVKVQEETITVVDVKSEVVPEDTPEKFWFSPKVTGGLLETEAEWSASFYEQAPCSSDTKELERETSAARMAAVEEVKSLEHVTGSKSTEQSETAMASLSGPASVSGIDISAVLAEKLLPTLPGFDSYRQHEVSTTELDSRNKQTLTDSGHKAQSPLTVTSETKLAPEKSKGETETVYSSYTTPGTVHFIFRVMGHESVKQPAPSAPVTKTMKTSLDAASHQVDQASVGEQGKTVYVDAGLVYGCPQYDSDQMHVGPASVPAKAEAEKICSETKLLPPPHEPMEVELGFVPSTETETATAAPHPQRKPSEHDFNQAAPSFESPFPDQPLPPRVIQDDGPPERKTDEQRVEDGAGGPAKAIQTKTEDAEDLRTQLHDQASNPEDLATAPSARDITESTVGMITSTSFDSERSAITSGRMQAMEEKNLFACPPLRTDGRLVERDLSRETSLLTEPPFLTYQKHKEQVLKSVHKEPHVQKDSLQPKAETEPSEPLSQDQGQKTDVAPATERELSHAEEGSQQGPNKAATEMPIPASQTELTPDTKEAAPANTEVVEYEGQLVEKEGGPKAETEPPVFEAQDLKKEADSKADHEEPHVEKDLSQLKVESEMPAAATQPDLLAPSSAPSADKETVQHEAEGLQQQMQSGAQVGIEAPLPQDQDHKTEAAPGTEPQLHHLEEDSSKTKVETEIPMTASQTEITPDTKQAAPANTEVVEYEGQLVEREDGPKAETEPSVVEAQDLKTEADSKADHEEPHVEKDLSQPKVESVLPEAATQPDLLAPSSAPSADKETGQHEGEGLQQQMQSGAQVEIEAPLPHDQDHKTEAAPATEPQLHHLEEDSSKTKVETEIPMTASQTEITPDTKQAAPANTEVVEYEGQLVEREDGPKAETEPSVVEAQDLKTEADSKADHEEPHVEKDLSQPKVESVLPEAATQPDLLAPSSAPSADKETVQHEGEGLQQQMQSGAQVEIEAPLPHDQDHKTEAAPGTQPQLHHLEEDSSKTKVETEIPMTASQTELTPDTKEAAPANTEVVEYEGQLVEREGGSKVETEPSVVEAQDLKTEADTKADHEEPHVEKDLSLPKVESALPEAATQPDLLAPSSAPSADKETGQHEGEGLQQQMQSGAQVEIEAPLPQDQDHKTETAPATEPQLHHLEDSSKTKVETEIPMTASRTELTPGTKDAAPADTEVVVYEGQLVEREVPTGPKAETGPCVVEAQDLKTETDSKADHEEPHVEKDLSQPKVESELPEAATQPDLLVPSSAPSADKETVQHEGEELQQQMQSGAQVEIEAPLPQDQDHKTEAAPATEPQLHHLEEDSSKTKVETEIPMTASRTELTPGTKEAAPADTEVVEYEGQLVEREGGSKAETEPSVVEAQDLKTEADTKADHEEPHVEKDLSQPKVESELPEAAAQPELLVPSSAPSADKETVQHEGEELQQQMQSGAQVEIEAPLPQDQDHKTEAAPATEPQLHHLEEDSSKTKVETEIPMTASRTELTPGTKEAAPADTEVVEYEGQLVEREGGSKAETEPSVVEAQDLKTEADTKADHEEPHVEKDLSQPKVESELPEAAAQPDLLAPSSAPSPDKETVQHVGDELQQQMQSGAQVEIEAPLPQDQDHKTEAAPATEPQLHHLEEDSSKTKVETEIPMTASRTELTPGTKEAAPADTEVVEYEGQLVEREGGSKAETEPSVVEAQDLKTEADTKADHEEPHVEKDLSQPKVESELPEAAAQPDLLAPSSAPSPDKETRQRLQQNLNCII